MRISIFLLHLRPGGVERAISDLANAFQKRGHQVTLWVTYNFGEAAYALDSALQIRYLTKRRPNREAFRAAVRRKNPWKILKEGLSALWTLDAKRRSFRQALHAAAGDDVLICTRHEQNRVLARLRGTSALRVAQLHHDVETGSRLEREIVRSYPGVDVVTVLTEELRRDLKRAFAHGLGSCSGLRTRPPRLVCMPNFLADSTPYIERSCEKPERLSQPRVRRHLISAGRLEYEKGMDRLLQVWTCLAPDFPDWTLDIAGDGSAREALRLQAETAGVSQSVRFLGMLGAETLARRFTRSDIFVLASRTEGFGLVLLEASATGLPLIAYDVRSGPRSLIRDGKNGYLIPDGDAFGYEQRCRELMRDAEKRRVMGDCARILAQRFSETKILKRWEAVLTKRDLPPWEDGAGSQTGPSEIWLKEEERHV